jgi:hypothetical protein
MKMPKVKKGYVPEILGRVFSQEKKPAGQPEATHSLENARDISISGNQRHQIIFRLMFNYLVHFLHGNR